MARPKCPRMIKNIPGVVYFKPRAIPVSRLEEIALDFDEFEAVRLADLEGYYQEKAAARMKVSRPTFGRILESARKKIADALVNGKAIKIEGGVISMAQKRLFQCSDCGHYWEAAFGTGQPAACPGCLGRDFHRADSGGGPASGGRGTCRHRERKLNVTVNREDK